MDATRFMEMLERHFELPRTDPVAAHAIYHDDAVLEFPSRASGSSASRTSASGAAAIRRR